MSQSCPCDSGLDYSLCCQPYLRGERVAKRPSQLMRSRYTAFVVHDVEWLINSWHPSCEAEKLRDSIIAGFSTTRWLGLTIFEDAPERDEEGFVSFIARYEENGKPGAIIERSRFLKEQGQWYYIDGTRPTPGRNDPCPCGCGKKFKKCCGR
ncbi:MULTISPECIES: YchJ family protein [Tenebrionibacter/Tenebrionicola group]|uniref:UPF0225 protein JJB97_00895 n=2 Tax=Tenebrionibacter/Tenebrionicola group TaxID=2969848 RepID=A0A8K0V231_9ENTR|nr:MULTISPECIES: YchJ family protein [Tenebrionibacter/Tenebrionicola group]MBK4713908.1 YchJ family protein [Tenebrionibacter intestinalis]MBV4411481.1 YchJ family protein [Tenebrionicola larvae]MBV5096374.1 YchJ family protein [Tenebrionicola larvae]